MATQTITLEETLSDPECAYLYARDGVQGRWTAGEPVIAQSVLYSYYYALDILHERFPLGEHVIAQDPYYANRYFNDFKDQFTEQESTFWLLSS
jgi:hypothetical protein